MGRHTGKHFEDGIARIHFYLTYGSTKADSSAPFPICTSFLPPSVLLPALFCLVVIFLV